MQGSIFLEGPVSILHSVCELSKLLFGASFYMVCDSWTKVVIIDELLTHPSVIIFLGWLHIRPCIFPLENCDHLIPNQRSVSNKRADEWSNSFRVTYN